MQHFIWVFTIHYSVHLGVSSPQRVNLHTPSNASIASIDFYFYIFSLRMLIISFDQRQLKVYFTCIESLGTKSTGSGDGKYFKDFRNTQKFKD